MKISDAAVMIVATGGGLGKVPVAPGTAGSLPGLLLCWGLSGKDIYLALGLTAALILLAIRVAHRAEKLLGAEDPGCVVIDEIAGMTITLLGLPFNAITALVGFIVFRLLDIFKPFPIRYVERRFSGGLGIVVDDVLAGVIGNLLIRAAMAALNVA
jgi:phosphatidylglycerophosphatase A